MNHSSTRYNTAIFCFFFSGFSGLIYEICWIRKASLVFGSTLFAASSVLAVFFLGLSIGSYLFGQIAQRVSRPLLIFAVLEIGLGMVALLTHHTFDFVNVLYGITYRALAGKIGLLFLVRIILVSMILLPPTILMGGTLPLFCRQYITDKNKITESVGFLYAINTLGAVFGAIIAGFVLIPQIGLTMAIQFGAAFNFLIAIIMGFMSVASKSIPVVQPVKDTFSFDRHSVTVSVLFFFSGFVALGNEILWIRYLSLIIRNNVYTYTLVLTVVLAGIVIGAILTLRFTKLSKKRVFYFGYFQVINGLFTLTFMMFPFIGNTSGNDLWIYFVLLLPPAVLSGASFPLAIRMVVDNPLLASIGVGRMSAINTFGGIFGSLFIGFIGLPFWGLKTSLLLTTGISLCIGFVAWRLLDPSVWRNERITCALTAWILIPWITGTRLPADFLGNRKELVAFREGFTSNLAVIRSHYHEKNLKKKLYKLQIDRLWQGENRKNHQIMVAHTPMLLHPDPRSILVVGVGVGKTASRFLMYNIDHLDCVDIEPKLFEFVHDYFDSTWMHDNRVNLIREDGRNYISHTNVNYDVISIEVGQLFRPGVPTFYTGEFYHLAKKRLNPGGLLIQFTPIEFLTSDEFRSILRTFLEKFPQSTLWYNKSELLLIGKKADKFEIDLKRIKSLLSNERINNDMKYSYWGSEKLLLNQLPVFLAGYLSGPRGLALLSAGAPSYSDNRPILEYLMSDKKPWEANLTPIAELLSKHLNPIEAVLNNDLSLDTVATIDKIRKENLNNMLAHHNDCLLSP